ncbi:VanZ family protein [Candidatus Curtissbacteria bacterium]|nr:VanZ family protein [Candidatus Curtissbacteria bacterium]
MKKTVSKLIYPKSTVSKWLPVFLWVVPFFYLSSIPSLHASQLYLADFIIKKGAHIGEFVGLYALIWRATSGKFVLSLLLCLIYSSFDEFHQSFVVGRTAALYDAYGFDLVGMLTSAYVIWKLKQLLHNKL